MRENTFIAALVLILSVNTVGFAISPEKFSKLVDVVACRAALATLQGKPRLEEFNKKFLCIDTTKYELEDIAAFLVNDTLTVSLIREAGTIKATEQVLSWDEERTLAFLTKDVFQKDSKYQEFASFAARRQKTGEFNDFVSKLAGELRPQLGAASTVQNSPISETSPRGTPWGATTDEGELFSWTNLVLAFLFLAALLQTAAIYFQHSRSQRLEADAIEVFRRLAKLEKWKDQESASIGGSREDVVKRSEFDDLRKRLVDEQKEAIGSMKSPASRETGASQFETPTAERRIAMVEEKLRPYEPRIEIVYLSSPLPDGSFDARSARDAFVDGKSIYQFRKTSERTAEFSVHDSEAASSIALQVPDRMIDPVCNASNRSDASTRRIITEKPGYAELSVSGDTWLLKKKAQIRYEH